MKPQFKYHSILFMGIFYIFAGLGHFINPLFYERIVPPMLPCRIPIVYISGIFEIVLGFLLFFQKTRFIACWGLVLLLIVIYPANIYVTLTDGEAMGITPVMAWARLPFQFVFIGIAYWHSKS